MTQEVEFLRKFEAENHLVIEISNFFSKKDI